MCLPDEVQKSVMFLGRWIYGEDCAREFDVQGAGFLVLSESKTTIGLGHELAKLMHHPPCAVLYV